MRNSEAVKGISCDVKDSLGGIHKFLVAALPGTLPCWLSPPVGSGWLENHG